jgi:hypothetical protein
MKLDIYHFIFDISIINTRVIIIFNNFNINMMITRVFIIEMLKIQIHNRNIIHKKIVKKHIEF